MSLFLPTLLPFLFFFFNDTATTEIYTLSLHDALPICREPFLVERDELIAFARRWDPQRSEEHTSELQLPTNLVCRLLLEKKNNSHTTTTPLKQQSSTPTHKHATSTP